MCESLPILVKCTSPFLNILQRRSSSCTPKYQMWLISKLLAGHGNFSIVSFYRWSSAAMAWSRALSYMKTWRLTSVWLSKWGTTTPFKILFWYIRPIRVHVQSPDHGDSHTRCILKPHQVIHQGELFIWIFVHVFSACNNSLVSLVYPPPDPRWASA